MIGKVKRLARYIFAAISPLWYSKWLYHKAFGRELDLERPVTLNEKLMWLKLHDYRNNELVTRCSDKYAVREYVREVGCEEILNELHGVWKSADEIEWDKLPERFVLKCNHASGFNIICEDKKTLDIQKSVKQLRKWMHREFWLFSAEMQYRGIPKRIICECFLGKTNVPEDYKFYCIHGEPVCVLVCREREKGWPQFYFFDCDWNFMPITKDGQKEKPDFTLEKPKSLVKMVEYARRLSAPFPFVRVDLYEEEGNVVFGELTFTPSACLDTDRLPETDMMFGEMLKLDL